MICSDTELGIGTSILASVVPLALPKMKHSVFIDAKAPKSVIDGVRMHKSSSRVQIYFYDEVADILGLLSMLGNSKSHLTMYFQTVIDGEILDLRSLFRNVPAQGKLFGSMTVFLDDRRGMGKIGPRSLGCLDLIEHHHGTNFLTDTLKHLKRKVMTIVAGSFFEAFGHSGGYITGHAPTIESLTWNTRGFLFSAPPLPLQATMTNRTIQLLEEGAFDEMRYRYLVPW